MRTHTPNMMADFSVVCVFLSLLLSSCLQPGCCQYQQIDLTSSSSGVSCSSSSVYTGSLDCNGALNGNTATIWKRASDPDANCFYTDGKGDENYWQVDLGQTRNIHKITIYPDMGDPGHMKNITVLVDQTRVFTFPDNIQNPTVITNNLPLRGNIIRLTKTKAFVVLCELQVEDCVSGRYGAQCQETCSQPVGCQPDTCDSITGDCTCRTEWSPPQCQVCADGYYGASCSETCSRGCRDTCNKQDGTCNCRTGWSGTKCDECADGYYGASCGTCSTGCSNTCNKQDGTCSCKTGWSGDKCDVCADGYYGASCGNTCSTGCSNTCNKQDGTCSCREGWTGTKCDACISGRYGPNCQYTCSAGCRDTACNKNGGTCSPCRTGWKGTKCDVCADGYYNNSVSGIPTAEDCIPCGSGCSDTCDGQSGYCTCRPGWEAPFCDQVCDADTFGQNCSLPCAPGCDGTCDAVKGNCTCGSQWIQPNCTDCSPGYYSPEEGCKPCNDGCENVTSCDPRTGACQACSPGFYGDTCFSPCTNCAGNGICSKQMGECETGCVEGWTGPACAQPLKTGGGDNGSTNTGAIVGAVLGAGVFIGIIVGALLIIRSRRSRASSQSEQFNGNMTSSVQETETAVDFPGESDTHNEAAASEQAWDDSNNYDMLRSYENSDDIKLYTSLQTNQSSTRRPDALNPAPRDTRVYEIPDVVYENTRTDNLT